MEREVTLLGSKESLVSMLDAAKRQIEEGGDAVLYIPGNDSRYELILRCEILGAGEEPIAGDGVLADFG